jgi:hypothetical protein
VRFRNTAILAAIVALVVAYLYFVERPAVEREAEKKTLVKFDPKEATGIVLEYPDRSLELTERDGKWFITKPRELEADQTTVESLLRATAEAELKRVADEKPGDFAKFGLAPPAATIRIRLEGGKSVPALAVGDSTPIGFNAYVRRGDETAVLLTAGTFQAGIKKDLEDLRDKSILRFEDAKVQKVVLRPAAGPATTVEREGDGWRIVEPIPTKADTNAVQSVLASLRSMRARGFDDGAGGDSADDSADEAPGEAVTPAADHGFTPPRFVAEVALEGGDRQTVELGGEKDAEGEKLVYVRVPGRETVYEVGAHSYASIAKTANELRDKTVLPVDPKDLTKLEVDRKDGEGFTLEREGDAWAVAGAAPDEVRESVADRLVEDVTTLKGSEVVSEPADPAAFGLVDAPLAIRLHGADRSLGQLHFASEGERHYVMAEGGPAVFAVPDYVYRRFDKRRSDLVEPPPEPTAAEGGAVGEGAEGAAKAAASPGAASSPAGAP